MKDIQEIFVCSYNFPSYNSKVLDLAKNNVSLEWTSKKKKKKKIFGQDLAFKPVVWLQVQNSHLSVRR